MTDPPNTTVRLDVPPAGGAIGATVAGVIIAFFVGVAVFNLWYRAALSPLEIGGSILWLCIVALVLSVGIADTGWRRALIHCLGVFSRRAFVELRPQPDGPEFRHGFECLGRVFEYARIDAARIAMVRWSAGQGSHMSGRDLADWSVGVWYGPPGRPGRWDRDDPRGLDILLVTPSLSRREAVGVGRAIVTLLGDGGVELEPGDQANEFVVTRTA